jgi:hypothetical protein
MFKAIKEFFTGKPAVVETPESAPYKVEVEAKVEAVNAQPVETVTAEVAAITAAPKKAPAKKQQFDKKPATKAKSTKPRNPRAKPATAK